MIRIHSIHIGQPQTYSDESGEWRSSIFRTPVTGPIRLGERGLEGDQVTDTDHHGSPDQAVCCHPIQHYDHWNDFYQLAGDARVLGPGSVGENWTLAGADEADLCLGDIYRVGSARVQVSVPRNPCWKQERKLMLEGFPKQTLETLRTGFYLRVLTPGMVEAGDEWILEERRLPDLTVATVNVCMHRELDEALAHRLVASPELAESWRRIFQRRFAARGVRL
jgi:MOSC domain-containing protein YiiM